MYGLLTAHPHEPPDAGFTDDERRVYRRGYQWAIVVALEVLQAAADNHTRAERARREQQRAAAAAERDRRNRLRLLLTRACAWCDVDRRRFCGAPASFLRVDGEARPIEFRCAAHRTDDCHPLPASVDPASPGEEGWTLEFETGELRAMKQRRQVG